MILVDNDILKLLFFSLSLFLLPQRRLGVKNAYFLPVRVHVDPDTFCLYPRAIEEDKWLRICGPEDRNCYAPKFGDPVYP